MLLLSVVVLAAEPESAPGQSTLNLATAAPKRYEELHLKPDPPVGGGPRAKLPAGRVLKGVVMDETRDSVDFTEIRQPLGRPMSLVVLWRFPSTKVDFVVRLDNEAEHAGLLRWVEDFKSREPEIDALKNLALRNIGKPGADLWHYESTLWPIRGAGSWLVIDGTAERETTERCVLRIEQVLAAYREVVPPRVQPTRPLQVKLFGTMQQFQAYLAQRSLPVENPAMFAPQENLLVAGSELSAYAEQLVEVRKHHDQVEAQLVAYDKSLAEKLAAYRKQLAAGGFTPDEQKKLTELARNNWNKERQEIERQIKIADRLNNEQFENVTRSMFVRLFHEAFHAYLENYVFPHADHDVPRWLNEGLAQIFERGQLEAGTLRLDAPDAKRLTKLHEELKSKQSLSLAEVLEADEGQFLVFHPGGAKASTQYYLYSWGLAYYLTFRQPLLETSALDEYVHRADAKLAAIPRFEKLVGMSLDKFEKQWRADMLSIKSGR